MNLLVVLCTAANFRQH